MQQVTMGKTGLQVSPLGMGVIAISRVEWQESIDIVRGVRDLGINWFDTAQAYGDTELRLGEALRDVRDEVIIVSKSGASTPDKLAAQFDDRLKRLGTDHLDVFLFHNISAVEDDSFFSPGGLLEVAEDAVRAGKVRFLGFSAHRVGRAIKALGVPSFSVAMVPINFISREFVDGEFMTLARERNVAVLGMKPMGGGRIEDPELCLKFLKTYPDVIPCIGVASVAEMAENVRYWERSGPLTPADHAEMARLRDELGSRFCRGCMYCMPCPEGISIWPVTFTKVFLRQFPRDRMIGWYQEKMDRARGCTECRECVEKCPYDLEIPEMLKENIAFYEEFVLSG